MRSIIIAIGLVLLVGTSASAGTWCDNWYPPIQSVPALFCDDFDTYCAGFNDPCPGGDGTESKPMLRNVWPRTSLNYRLAPDENGDLIRCGAEFDIEHNQSLLTSEPFGGRENCMGDENGDLGQQTVNLVPWIKAIFGEQYDQVPGTDEYPLYLRVNMSGGLRSAAATDLSHAYLELALEQEEERKQAYLDPEVAPTDYIMVGAEETEGCNSCYALCQEMGVTNGSGVHAAWPTICQSYDARTASSLCPDPDNPEGPPISCGPPYCPPVPVDKIHNALAIGALAMLDPNPCHCEFPPVVEPYPIYHNQGMKNPHLAFFDGWKWRSLREGDYGEGATGSGDFLVGDKTDTIEIWIKTNTVDIHHISKQWINGPDPYHPDQGGYWEDPQESWAYNVPRKYLGTFNALRTGTSSGCELRNDVYDCILWAGTKCHNMTGSSCLGGGVDDGSNYISWDSLVLLGGAPPPPSPGACCLPDGQCIDGVTLEECETTWGGSWKGWVSTCAETLCCPIPFGDRDADGDVDQQDFGLWQACYSGPGNAYIDGCECYDRNDATGAQGGDGDVDRTDFDWFENCVTGPTIPLDTENPPTGCIP